MYLSTSKFKLRLLPLCALICLFAVGCQNSVLGVKAPQVYVRQGNVIDSEDFEKIKPGMTTEQVLYLVGTPTLRDPFLQDIWDYYTSYELPGNILVRKHIQIRFEDNRVLNWEELKATFEGVEDEEEVPDDPAANYKSKAQEEGEGGIDNEEFDTDGFDTEEIEAEGDIDSDTDEFANTRDDDTLNDSPQTTIDNTITDP